MPMRAPFISAMTYVTRPRRRSPTSSAGVSLNCISHVGDPWMPILTSVRRMRIASLRSVRNRLRPMPPVSSVSLRASTSSTSPQPFVMNRLTPWRRHCPVSSW